MRGTHTHKPHYLVLYCTTIPCRIFLCIREFHHELKLTDDEHGGASAVFGCLLFVRVCVSLMGVLRYTYTQTRAHMRIP